MDLISHFIWINLSVLFGILPRQKGSAFAVVVISPVNVTVSENDPVTLTCTLTGTTEIPSSFSWYLKSLSQTASVAVGILMSSCKSVIVPINTTLYSYTCSTRQSTWTIKNITRQNHEYRYQCNIDKASGSENSEYTFLNVQVPISSVTMTVPSTVSVTVRENATIDFQCKTSGGRPEATITWYKDSGTPETTIDDIAITSNIQTSSITIIDLIEVTSTLRYSSSRTDNGWRIYCTATNINGQTPIMSQRKPQLNVQYPPVIGELKNSSVVEGSPVTVPCPVTVGNPPETTFEWIRNGQVWRRTQDFTIDTASRTDAMIYTCKVSNSMQQTGKQSVSQPDTKSFYLNVLYSTNVTEFYISGHRGETAITMNETDPLPFKCIADSNPGSNLSIIYRKNVMNSQTSTNSLDYIIGSAQCTDSGVYSCEGFNQYNREYSTRSLSLFINCRPRPSPYVSLRENVICAQHHPALLTFTALAYPEPSADDFIWYRWNRGAWFPVTDSKKFLVDTSGLQTNLTVIDVNLTYFEMYKLEVQNNIGRHVQIFHLIPEDGPSTSARQSDSCTAVGSSLGVVLVILAIYAGTVTILWRRKTTAKVVQKKEELEQKLTYVNLSFKQGNTDAQQECSEKTQYTSLERQLGGDRTTYDVLEAT